jgi:hypothetical protein
VESVQRVAVVRTGGWGEQHASILFARILFARPDTDLVAVLRLACDRLENAMPSPADVVDRLVTTFGGGA